MRAYEFLTDAIHLGAPHRRIPNDELQGYLGRIKHGKKTKKDKLGAIVHASNIKFLKSKDSEDEWDLNDLADQITKRPNAILGTNAKMSKSAKEGEIVYDLTLPALKGIIIDEDTGEFVEINTCPGAGHCQLICYARKGGYVMFPASSMSSAQALNFLINDPTGYNKQVSHEIHTIEKLAKKKGIKLVVRWHDAGDFFSTEYFDLAKKVAIANPTVDFYAYTKIADVALSALPDNFIMNFSSGAKPGEDKKIQQHKAKGHVVKQGITVPKELFAASKQDVAKGALAPVIALTPKGKPIKDAQGRTQFIDAKALHAFKHRLAAKYGDDVKSIITYDEMLAKPVGKEPKWNVIVQPGAGDRAANRRDVINSYLMFH